MDGEQENVWQTYALDAADALREIEESLLVLEARPDAIAEVHALYRALHTLKGNSAVMGLPRIEQLAHVSEDMVGCVREDAAALDAEMIELMLLLTDRLAQLTTMAAREHRDADEEQVLDLITRVQWWRSQHGAPETELQGAGRGQVMVWSSLPPAHGSQPPSHAGEVMIAREILLSLARDALPRLLMLGSPSTREERAAAQHDVEALVRAAQEAGEVEVSGALAELTQALACAPYESARCVRSVLALVAALEALERRYQQEAEFPQSFDIAALSAVTAGLPTPQVQSFEPLDRRALGAEGKPLPKLSSPASAELESKADFLRIDARKLSLLMDLTGEIALACGAVTHHPELAGRSLEGFAAATHKLEVLIRELQNEVSAMRLVPVAGVFQRMKRVVRDTAKRTGKRVHLTLLGEETEIDKVMVDCLHDPLVHLLRNAIDHGIESPEERLSAGKPELGQIVLEASHQGGEVLVRVRDDGRGLACDQLLARAKQRGLVASDANLSDQQVRELIFLPGFSTKESADSLSGRGVGMDVVKNSIEGMRGRVQLESRPGHGSCFDLTMPLTLAFVESMVVSHRERLFALPIEKVCEVFKVERDQLWTNSADGETMVRVRERLIRILWLDRFFGDREADEGPLEGRVIVIVQTSRGHVALPVDVLLGNQPIMLKPLSGLLAKVRAAAGCGMLRTGDVALALDCEQLHV